MKLVLILVQTLVLQYRKVLWLLGPYVFMTLQDTTGKQQNPF